MDIRRTNKEYELTTNRKAYNRIRKETLDRHGEISCSHCRYNRGENDRRRFYYKMVHKRYKTYAINIHTLEPMPEGFKGFEHRETYDIVWKWQKEYTHTVTIDRRPNWKLISKNKKQWQSNKLRLPKPRVSARLEAMGYELWEGYKW